MVATVSKIIASAASACVALTLCVGAAAPAQAVTTTDDGLLRHDAFVDDKVKAGYTSFTAMCPPSHPYLKRFHTGTYDDNGDGSRPVPGGVIVYEAGGPVWVSAGMTRRTVHMAHGPSGYKDYEVYGGITGHYAGWGGTHVRVVLWCVSDPANGAVANIRYPDARSGVAVGDDFDEGDEPR